MIKWRGILFTPLFLYTLEINFQNKGRHEEKKKIGGAKRISLKWIGWGSQICTGPGPAQNQNALIWPGHQPASRNKVTVCVH